MKTSMKTILTLTLAGTFVAALTAAADIQTAKGGARQLLTPAPVVEAAAAPAATAMACPKCSTAKLTYANTSRGGVTEFRSVEQHVCPSCSTRIEAVGHGKAKKDVAIHTCALAENNASCCK